MLTLGDVVLFPCGFEWAALALPMKFFAGLAFAVLLVACQTPPPPIGIDAPAPDTRMAWRSKTPLSVLGNGYAVYLRQCSQCHVAKLPTDMTKEQWHVIIPGMAWNAGIDAKEEHDVLAYMSAASGLKKEEPKP
jgi:mono/diheme cytochrome c family protein